MLSLCSGLRWGVVVLQVRLLYRERERTITFYLQLLRGQPERRIFPGGRRQRLLPRNYLGALAGRQLTEGGHHDGEDQPQGRHIAGERRWRWRWWGDLLLPPPQHPPPGQHRESPLPVLLVAANLRLQYLLAGLSLISTVWLDGWSLESEN